MYSMTNLSVLRAGMVGVALLVSAVAVSPAPATVSSDTVYSAPRLAAKPKLAYKPKKRAVVVKTQTPSRTRVFTVVTVTEDGNRTKRRVSSTRKRTRIALPASVATVRVRTLRPVKSRWARLTITPGTGNPGTPGNPGNGGNDGTNADTPNYTDSPIPAEQHRNAIAVLNQARTAGGYCGDTYYPPQPALRENALLTEIAVYSAQRLADPYSPPTAPTPRQSSWLALSRNPAALGQPFTEATVGATLADKVGKGQGCAAVHDPAFTDVGVGLAYSYPKIDGQPVAGPTHANLIVMLGTP